MKLNRVRRLWERGYILGIIIEVFLLFGLVIGASAGSSLTEAEKIEGLIQAIQESKATFIRNGEEYPAAEAAQHLRKKLNSAQSSVFAPKKEKWTAVLFIEKVASKSTISGKPYFIRTPGGKNEEAEKWLLEKLNSIERQSHR